MTSMPFSYSYNELTLRQRGPDSVLYIWVVKPGGDVTFKAVDLQQYWRSQNQPPQSFAELISITRAALGVRGIVGIRSRPNTQQPIQQSTQRLKQLHQLLIEPIAHDLPSNPDHPVIFVPQDALFMVPFPALQDATGTYLIEKHTTLTAPAIQILDLTRQQQERVRSANLHTVLVVGNPFMPSVPVGIDRTWQQLPPLPGAEREARAIANLLRTTPLIGREATETLVVQAMQTARVIHLATHGLLNDFGTGVPGAIALAPDTASPTHLRQQSMATNAMSPHDGLLTAVEIAQLNLNIELAILSACDTAHGEITGDGVIGLSRSLIAAGTANVIVSLWAVPDAPTAQLMTEFHRQWQQTGNKGHALRRAMLATKAAHPNPRNWAAFTLIGEVE